MSIKDALWRLALRLSTVPYVGHFVRMALAAYLGPETREYILQMREVYAGQLPSILETLSSLNHRALAIDRDHENLITSAPVALRTFRRELVVLSRELDAHKESLEYLLNRIESMRAELFYETLSGSGVDYEASETPRITPRIVRPDKLAAARASSVRLNLDGGLNPRDDYLNVDRVELPGVDIVADASSVPVEAGEVDEIFSVHLLHRFPERRLRTDLLPYWKSLLKPSGTFRTISQEPGSVIERYITGECSADDLREAARATGPSLGRFHHNWFTPEHLGRLLAEAGFEDVRVDSPAARNGPCREFVICATKPES